MRFDRLNMIFSLTACVEIQSHEKEMYLSLFEQADLDRDGYVSSSEAVEFLRKSELGNNELAEVAPPP